jgi:hypothetical protein
MPLLQICERHQHRVVHQRARHLRPSLISLLPVLHGQGTGPDHTLCCDSLNALSLVYRLRADRHFFSVDEAPEVSFGSLWIQLVAAWDLGITEPDNNQILSFSVINDEH